MSTNDMNDQTDAQHDTVPLPGASAGHEPASTAEASTGTGSGAGSDASTAPASTAATPAPAAEIARNRPRTGSIVWGTLVLAFCGYLAARTVRGDDIEVGTWIIATTIGLGVLLLAVGVAVLIRGRRTPH